MGKSTKIHMLRPAPDDAIVRETICLRTSHGGGIGKQVRSFVGDRGWFDATEVEVLVSCKQCLTHMRRPA